MLRLELFSELILYLTLFNDHMQMPTQGTEKIQSTDIKAKYKCLKYINKL